MTLSFDTFGDDYHDLPRLILFDAGHFCYFCAGGAFAPFTITKMAPQGCITILSIDQLAQRHAVNRQPVPCGAISIYLRL